MRQGPNSRRSRGRNNHNNSGNGARRPNLPNRNQTFDSNGPDVRIRGNAYQVCEKYQALARDAASSGDRVMAENYLQHAEHYHRIILSMNEAHAQAASRDMQAQQPQQGGRANGREFADGAQPMNGQRSQHADGGAGDAARRGPAAGQEMPRDGDQAQAMRAQATDQGVTVAFDDGDPRDNDAAVPFGSDPRQSNGGDGEAEQTEPSVVPETVAAEETSKDAEPPAEKPQRRRRRSLSTRSATNGNGDAGEQSAPVSGDWASGD